MSIMKKIFIGIILGIVALIGAGIFLIYPPKAAYYTQIDNAKREENHSDGGVVDLTGNMRYLYTLESYSSDGHEKEITFGADNILKDNAYLKLEYAPIRGVLSWCEVEWEDLPPKVQSNMQRY